MDLCAGTTLEGWSLSQFGWNQCSSFDNMHVFLILLENAYSRHKIVGLGFFDP